MEVPSRAEDLEARAIQVDNNMPARIDYSNGPAYFFGLAFGDLNGYGYKDIVAHNMFYKNPAGNMQGAWVSARAKTTSPTSSQL